MIPIDLKNIKTEFKNNVVVRNSTLDDVSALSPDLRPSDLTEIKACYGTTGHEALLSSFNNSIHCLSIVKESSVIGMFGISHNQDDKNCALIWLLGSNALESYAYELVRYTKKYVKLLMSNSSHTKNYIDCRNTTSINWLKKIGFNFIKLHHNFGYECRGFWEFEMKKDKKFNFRKKTTTEEVFDYVLLGSSGYIGSNILKSLNKKLTYNINRKEIDTAHQAIVDLSEKILDKNHKIFHIKAKKIIICSRPSNLNYEINKTFYHNLHNFLLNAINYTELKEIHFLSTTNVYDFDTENFDQSLSSPHGLYEYFKLETELFLKYLSKVVRSDLTYNIYRLPVVLGGTHTRAQTPQIMQIFFKQYLSGHHWEFNSEKDKSYGTSWIDIDDLVHLILYEKHQVGKYHVINPSNGFASYLSLQEIFSRNFQIDKKKTGRLPAIKLKIDNNTKIKEKNIEPHLIPFIKAHEG